MLCQACQNLFCGDLASKLQPSTHSHHTSVSSFHNAVQQNCYICLSIWQELDEQQRAHSQLRDTSQPPTSYKIHGRPDLPSTLIAEEYHILAQGMAIVCDWQEVHAHTYKKIALEKPTSVADLALISFNRP